MNSFLILLNFSLILFLLGFELLFRRRDLFYPTSLFLLFSLIVSFVSLYFVFVPAALYQAVGESSERYSFVSEMLLVYVCVNLLVYLSFRFFMALRLTINFPGFSDFARDLFLATRNGKNASLFFLFLSIILFFCFIEKVGGLGEILANISARQDVYAGSGYLMEMSIISMQFFSVSSYYKLYSFNRLISFVIVFIAAGLLLLLGSRMAVFGLIFMVLTVHHFMIKPFCFRMIYVPLFLFSIFLAIMIGDLRSSGSFGFEGLRNHPKEGFGIEALAKKLMPYTMTIQRDSTILSYFDSNEYWYGKSYISILTAPIPRVFYSEKPPVDTGRYVVAMHRGDVFMPPVASDDLPNYGWPPSYMEGYMNFGYFGLFFGVVVSVGFVSFVYKLALLKPSIPLLILYSSLMFRNSFYFSSLGFVSTLTLIVFVMAIAYSVKFFRRIKFL